HNLRLSEANPIDLLEDDIITFENNDLELNDTHEIQIKNNNEDNGK
ncbi:24243_t:CDS:2, partial [Racocetra persica]